ncbi:MAG TPA: hypothetical protein PKV98_11510 [Burkholderiaceae bacterium]|nr:hypothetical protein [Burkholderiaceae bacterium]
MREQHRDLAARERVAFPWRVEGRARILLCCGLFLASGLNSLRVAAAETEAATLNGVQVPVTLSGRWDYEGQRSNSWSVKIDRLHPDGRIEGSITWWGVRCSVKGEAISEGSWRDGKLNLRAPTDNRYVCGDLVVELSPGSVNLFEGTGTSSLPGATVKAWLERPM